jgi:uncharacterized protein YjbI with pentapeptide repeats
MTRSIPPELLAKIDAHWLWLKSSRKEGQQFKESEVDLSDQDLSDRSLTMVVLSGARFDRSVLRDIDMSDSYFIASSFIKAILDDSWLVMTDASESNFSEASLCRVRAVSIELMKADLRKADLTEGNFYDADFQDANLEEVNFSHADLRGAYCPRARMAHAVLTGAILQGAKFSGAIGMELVEAEWINIGTEDAPQRLEGEQARSWLLVEAAKP